MPVGNLAFHFWGRICFHSNHYATELCNVSSTELDGSKYLIVNVIKWPETKSTPVEQWVHASFIVIITKTAFNCLNAMVSIASNRSIWRKHTPHYTRLYNIYPIWNKKKKLANTNNRYWLSDTDDKPHNSSWQFICSARRFISRTHSGTHNSDANVARILKI